MAFGDAYEDGEFVLLEVEVGAVMGVTVYYSFSCPGGYFTIDFDFSNSPVGTASYLWDIQIHVQIFPFVSSNLRFERIWLVGRELVGGNSAGIWDGNYMSSKFLGSLESALRSSG
jgi:hypothetical protein